MKLRKILLINVYCKNSGDYAITHTTLGQFEKLGPGIDIAVHCSDPHLAKLFTNNTSVTFRDYLLPVAKYPPGAVDCIRPGILVLSNMLTAVLYRLTGKKIFVFNNYSRHQLQDFFDSDIIVSTGGGYLDSNYGFFRAYYDFMIARILGKRLILYGQSIGPFQGIIRRFISRLALGAADSIIVRETRSERHLKDLGLNNVTLGADLAFAFPYIPQNKARDGSHSPKVIMCPRSWTYPKRKSAENYLSFIGTLSKKLIEEHGLEVIMFPSAEEDIRFHSILKPYLPKGVRFIDKILSPHDLADFISEADFLISSRMHPIILGSLSSTPFFALSWEYKLEEICPLITDEDCLADAESLDNDTQDMIIKSLERKSAMRKNMLQKLPGLKKNAEKNIEIIRGLIKSWGYELY